MCVIDTLNGQNKDSKNWCSFVLWSVDTFQNSDDKVWGCEVMLEILQ